jgi:hypothetical protein
MYALIVFIIGHSTKSKGASGGFAKLAIVESVVISAKFIYV